jgi:hypothetical protein
MCGDPSDDNLYIGNVDQYSRGDDKITNANGIIDKIKKTITNDVSTRKCFDVNTGDLVAVKFARHAPYVLCFVRGIDTGSIKLQVHMEDDITLLESEDIYELAIPEVKTIYNIKKRLG